MGRRQTIGLVATSVVMLAVAFWFLAGLFTPAKVSPITVLDDVAPVVESVARVHDLNTQPAGEPVLRPDGSTDPARWRVQIRRGEELIISGAMSPVGGKWGFSRMAMSSPPDWWDAPELGVGNPNSVQRDPPLELLVVVATGIPPKSQHFNRPFCWATEKDVASRLFSDRLPRFESPGTYAVDVLLLTREPDSGVPELTIKNLQRVDDRPLGVTIARYEVDVR